VYDVADNVCHSRHIIVQRGRNVRPGLHLSRMVLTRLHPASQVGNDGLEPLVSVSAIVDPRNQIDPRNHSNSLI